ncbi:MULTISPECIES: sarcosine oxidase subunit delta [Acetobacter]|uniref:Sarcosine oxidase subunit delta n=1 Tax=Acetobacter thailandicus TaxID=1502842 RepID=A0ABT3QC70_9PROT|nr:MULTISPECIES: sarcosine oxidase subunit delta [Acetobacter]MBS0958988.1 sarcosine oxidase subunit delta [Acetobacter thailandicus]MBS0985125.1 sarcosine oxidase subunit delta [Acetobacter thailandicus]MBS1003336.1 sarcosine oxidase subunit delta [Acetobacter thailandicus]MCX2562829.1 sarcosine oxidase subunit delta [Acetobacter thailandicus]NHN94894.1 sarcosine oxidase subunit delta [Acetobacter thailandicus]
MRITCPHCGSRGLEEFTYRGDATVRRPAPDAPHDAWVDYVYLRDNPAGLHKELWYHGNGCRSWIVAERNTITHEIHSTRLATEALSEEKSGS